MTTFNAAELFLPRIDAIQVIDPELKTRVDSFWVPLTALVMTDGLHSRQAGTRSRFPSLCLLFQNGRCPLGHQCLELHGDSNYIASARQILTSSPVRHKCCFRHGDWPSSQYNFRKFCDETIFEIRLKSVVLNVSSHCIAMTCYWVDFLESAETNNFTQSTVTIRPGSICGFQHRAPTSVCKSGALCQYVHVCRDVWQEWCSAQRNGQSNISNITPPTVPSTHAKTTAPATVANSFSSQPSTFAGFGDSTFHHRAAAAPVPRALPESLASSSPVDPKNDMFASLEEMLMEMMNDKCAGRESKYEADMVTSTERVDRIQSAGHFIEGIPLLPAVNETSCMNSYLNFTVSANANAVRHSTLLSSPQDVELNDRLPFHSNRPQKVDGSSFVGSSPANESESFTISAPVALKHKSEDDNDILASPWPAVELIGIRRK